MVVLFRCFPAVCFTVHTDIYRVVFGRLEQKAVQGIHPIIDQETIFCFFQSVSVFETFFLAIYNEEILEPTPSNAYAKKVCWISTVAISY